MCVACGHVQHSDDTENSGHPQCKVVCSGANRSDGRVVKHVFDMALRPCQRFGPVQNKLLLAKSQHDFVKT